MRIKDSKTQLKYLASKVLLKTHSRDKDLVETRSTNTTVFKIQRVCVIQKSCRLDEAN